MTDMVNHPPHYTSHPAKCSCGSGIECIDVVEHMTFNLGNAVKYIWRCGMKGDQVEDLRKAEFYIRREIARLTKQERDATAPEPIFWHRLPADPPSRTMAVKVEPSEPEPTPPQSAPEDAPEPPSQFANVWTADELERLHAAADALGDMPDAHKARKLVSDFPGRTDRAIEYRLGKLRAAAKAEPPQVSSKIERLIAAIDGLNANGWTPTDDNDLVQGIGRGKMLQALAEDMGRDRQELGDRWRALVRVASGGHYPPNGGIGIDEQAALAKAVRLRAERAVA